MPSREQPGLPWQWESRSVGSTGEERCQPLRAHAADCLESGVDSTAGRPS